MLDSGNASRTGGGLEEPITAPLRVAMVGIGQRSVIGLHVGNAPTPARIVAAADISDQGRERALNVFGRDIDVLESHHDLILANAVDCVIITTPDATHAEIATDFLTAGIPVFVDKPLATTLEDADAVLRAAAKTGTALYVGHNFRHAAVVQVMKSVIDSGAIGEVKTVWCRHFVGDGADYYFKDWHADRRNVTGLLLQKASHDIDVIHMLAGGYTRRVVGMGDLMVYGQITDRGDRQGETMADWYSLDNWPPLSNTGLNPVVDVEDVSMMMMKLDNGVLASYQQCHFSPDYWRNYTVIGTEGRLENIGDTAGGVVRIWNRRHATLEAADRELPIGGVPLGHSDADAIAVNEFLALVAHGTPPTLSPIAAREAVATGERATVSLRSGSTPQEVPPVGPKLAAHFAPAYPRIANRANTRQTQP